MTVLGAILGHKRQEVQRRKAERPLAALRTEAAQQRQRGFRAALAHKVAAQTPAVIAELKKASPSRGVIRKSYEPAAIARSYEAAGAACLSVLTDAKHFQGADEHLRCARSAVSIPVLRKEFIVDAYQVVESCALGADCILLIAGALPNHQLAALHEQACGLGLDVLVEVHDAAELEAALTLKPTLVGINNRNLKTFETRIETTLSLLDRIPDNVLVVAESGFHDRTQVQAILDRGVGAFLVGEAFMRAQDPGASLGELFSGVRPACSPHSP